MGTIKTGSGDPAELVRQKIEDFRLGIYCPLPHRRRQDG
jgi:hypothetical protein